jgi:Tol biopolymer transport system component
MKGASRGFAPDVPDDALRDHIANILRSTGFARSDRLKRFLTYAIERSRAGDIESLKEYSVALRVFDRRADYDPKIDAVVRVEARRLRSRLEQYYATDGSNDLIRIRFPRGTYVPQILSEGARPAATKLVPSLQSIPRPWLLLAGGLVGLAAAVVAFHLPLRRHTAATITRLVFDSTAAVEPAISRDGRTLAYASDQAGNVDIWMRRLDSTQTRRLTSDPAVDTSPDFSPDSSQLAFRSDRNGGGVYLLSITDGSERLLAPLGRSPKFSPDGKWIAYWTGQSHHFQGKVFLVPVKGGKPLRLAADLADAKQPVWSSDGKTLLVYGSRVRSLAGGAVPGAMDLFVVPVEGGPARESGWTKALHYAGIWSQGPVAWDGSIVQFSAMTVPTTDFSSLTQPSANLWRAPLSQDRARIEGQAQRVTFGAAFEQSSAIDRSGGAVFASTHYSVNILETRLVDDARAQSPGPAFSGPGSYVMPALSRDGSTLIALSDRSGQVDVWLKNLRTGEERAVTSTAAIERSPQISDDGANVFFGIRQGGLYPMYRVSSRGGTPDKVCADCGTLSDISPDGKYVLYHAGEPWSVYCLDVKRGRKVLLGSKLRRTYSSRFSPDGKWIAFHADTGEDDMPRRIFVVPFRPNVAIPEEKWIPITDGQRRDSDVSWSGDGSTLFFFSDRDGNRCIWAMRLNPQTREPSGVAFPLIHLHRFSRYAPEAIGFGVSTAAGRLVFGAVELTSTVFRAEAAKR